MECAVCSDTFTDVTVLPCLHRVCSLCVDDLLTHDVDPAQTSSILTCPACHEPIGTVDAVHVLPHQSKTTAQSTNICRLHQQIPAEWFCGECNITLCTICLPNHNHPNSRQSLSLWQDVSARLFDDLTVQLGRLRLEVLPQLETAIENIQAGSAAITNRRTLLKDEIVAFLSQLTSVDEEIRAVKQTQLHQQIDLVLEADRKTIELQLGELRALYELAKQALTFASTSVAQLPVSLLQLVISRVDLCLDRSIALIIPTVSDDWQLCTRRHHHDGITVTVGAHAPSINHESLDWLHLRRQLDPSKTKVIAQRWIVPNSGQMGVLATERLPFICLLQTFAANGSRCVDGDSEVTAELLPEPHDKSFTDSSSESSSSSNDSLYSFSASSIASSAISAASASVSSLFSSVMSFASGTTLPSKQPAAQEQDEPSITFSPSNPSTTIRMDRTDGAYVITLWPPSSGLYTLIIKVDGNVVVGCPMRVQVLPQRKYDSSLKSSLILGGEAAQMMAMMGRDVPMTEALRMGGRGPEGNRFSLPSGVAVTRSGNIVIAECGNHRLHVLDPSFNTVRLIGSQGTGPGQFQFPHGVAATLDGLLWVADRDNNRLQCLTEEGVMLRELNCLWPVGVVALPDGSIIATEGRAASIMYYPGDGSAVHNIALPIRQCVGLSLTPHSDYLLACDAYRQQLMITKLVAGGTEGLRTIGEIGDMSAPSDVICLPGDRLLVTELVGRRLSLWTLDGRLITRLGNRGFGSGQFNFPWGLALLPDGQIVVTDQYNHRVQILN